MIQKDYDYISGTAAKKLQYDVYEENTVLKAKKLYKNSRIAKFKLVLSIFAVFIAGLVVVCRFAMITQMSYNISESEKAYNSIRSENSIIRMQVERDTDLTRIKEIAETKLGMQKPDKSQIVYVRVPKCDHTLVMDSGNRSEKIEETVVNSLLNKVLGFINLIS